MTDPAQDTVDVERVLAEWGAVTQDAVLSRIPDDRHSAFLYDVMRDYPSRPSKFLRPALCLAACECFGGQVAEALDAAVAIELMHNAFLIHDDIADGSVQRRGRPTLHEAHGIGTALNAGDGLAVLAQKTLRQAVRGLDVGLGARLLDEFDLMSARTIEGQAMELGWAANGLTDVRTEDYLDLVMHKSCWYTTIHPLRIGAIIGSRGAADVEPMIRFGFHLGAAFQIRDDVLNLVGDEGTYGKEIGGDLYEGKRTLMLIHLSEVATGSDRALLDDYLRADRSGRTDSLVAEVMAMMERHGSITFAQAYGDTIADEAHKAFEIAFASAPPSPARDFIEALIPYMLDRNR
ncbi:MAG: polyprenyl synthetase family protein [Acidimicrobiales bacterium]|nr:polyprenyl synthetase family protein [Acidimicrobiales bacterium]